MRHLFLPVGESKHFPGEHPETGDARSLFALFEKHLHAETDSEQIPAGGDKLPDGTIKAALPEIFHAVSEVPDSRQNAAIESVQLPPVRNHPCRSADKFQRFRHRTEVAHVVIDQSYAH